MPGFTDADRNRLILSGLPKISFESANKFQRTWQMFLNVCKAIDDTVNFSQETRKMILNVITSSIPQERVLAWLAAKETIDTQSNSFANTVRKELARIGNIDISTEQAAIDYSERKQMPGESVASFYAELKALKDARGDVSEAIFAKDFERKLRKELAIAVKRRRTGDDATDDNPVTIRERALEEEELLRFGSNDTNDTNPVGLFMVNALQSVTDRLERMNTSNGNPRNNCDQRRSSIRCHFCRQFGHVRKFCPKLKGKGKTANKGNCYNCNRPGHFKRECPWESANERPGNQYGTAGWGGGSSQRYPRR